jgi:DNA-binding PadR family transcriptional regulator
MTAPRPLGYWLTTLDRLLEEQVEDALAERGLGRREWHALGRLEHGAVAEDVAVDLLPAVESLVAAGLVEHRSGEYRLTPEGGKRVTELQEGPVQAVAERAAEGLSAEQYDALLGALEQVATNLGWLADGQAEGQADGQAEGR